MCNFPEFFGVKNSTLSGLKNFSLKLKEHFITDNFSNSKKMDQKTAEKKIEKN